ncbi:uncharacterized protein [Temnothorax longispinosus]|uniref:Uncharacterized protein n=1 Tax=Temnothorax longispinosus TaxID=300112 RepID=A0A4S2JB92_9HYME|nr:Uncharacterized protein DBV15_00962 [Temnothorax longispinosus]
MEGSKEILTMSAMNPILYRVETYILPEAENLEEHLSVQKTEYQSSVGPEESLYPVRHFSRINSLISIDERSENSLDTKVSDYCRHGYKNGCTSSVSSPEEISDEIFKGNWLQKIEVLKDRETMLREREMNLQKRERELFRKEKKLRIAERILNDKMRQVDELLKLQINPLVDRRLEEAARILSDIEKSGDNLSEYKIPKKDVTRKEDISKKEEIPEKEDISKKEEIPRKDVTRNEYISKKEEIPKKEDISKKGEIPRKDVTKKEDILKREEVARKEEVPRKVEIPRRVEIPKNPQVNPIFDQRHRREESNKKIIHPTRSNSSSRKSSVSRTHSYASVRYRERPRMNYDDLNSTLSAASQDSPKLRTSQWFDPALYQKPHVFQRSASERHPRHKDTTGNTMGKLQKVVEERLDPVIEEEKIFRKVSDNICALQKNEAGFQNYGLVDRIPSIPSSKTDYTENRLSSYLDLEIGSKRHSRQNLSSASKDRPVSWTSETNEELQKKRQVYDSMTKQSAETKQSTENKENVACHTTNKIQKKKSKKFFLFR